MASTDLVLMNAALTRTGNDPISDLQDGSAGATIAANNYDEIVEAELSDYPWKFATKIEQLSLIDEDVHGTPPEPWLYAYQLPADSLGIRTAKVGGTHIDYAVHGDTILTNMDSSNAVIGHVVWRPAEENWPKWFRRFIVIKMEAVFLRGIGERYAEAEQRDKAADKALRMARLRDSQSQPGTNPVSSPTLEARRA